MINIVGADEPARGALVAPLIAALGRRGRTVSVLARVAPEVELDRPGKDSDRHLAAGARGVALVSAGRYAVIHAPPPREKEPSFAALLARLGPVDIVFALGFDAPEGETLRLGDGAIELASGRRFAPDDVDGVASCLADAS